MKTINKFRIRLAAILVFALILQTGVPVSGAQIKTNLSGNTVSRDKTTLSSNTKAATEVKPASSGAKASTDTKPTIEVKSTSDTKASSDSKASSDTKPAIEVKPLSDTKASSDSKTSTGSKPTIEIKTSSADTSSSADKASPDEDEAEAPDSSVIEVNENVDRAPGDDSWLLDDFKATINDRYKYLMLSKYTGSSNTVIVPHTATIGSERYDTRLQSDCAGLFEGNEYIEYVDLHNVYANTVTDMSRMFAGCTNLKVVSMDGLDTYKVGFTAEMFSGCTSLTEVNIDNMDTSAVADMSNMFNGCSSLTSLDLSKNNTSFAKKMSGMFDGCIALRSLDLTGAFDTSKVTDTSRMFYFCKDLSDLKLGEDFKTSRLKFMTSMFEECRSLTKLDLSGWDLTNVKSSESVGVFEACSALEEIDIPIYVRSEIRLPATFVKRTDKSTSYETLPTAQKTSFKIIKGSAYIDVKGVSVTPASTSILEEESDDSLSANISPDNASNKTVKWSSADESIVTVNEDTGEIYGVSVGGPVKVIATSVDGGLQGECLVTVETDDRRVASVTVDPTVITELEQNRSQQLDYEVLPRTAVEKGVTWSSANPKIATVDEDGNVTGVSNGTTTITVTTVDRGKTATCTVTVVDTKVTDIDIPETFHEMNINDTYSLSVNISPDDATNQELKYWSEDPYVASVNKKGVVRGDEEGETIIHASTPDGKHEDTMRVKVNTVHVSGCKLSKQTLTLYSNGTTGPDYQLTYTLKPEDPIPTNTNVTWTTSNKDVAKVSSTGLVSPGLIGNATITIETEDGDYTDTCDVKVELVSVDSIKVQPIREEIHIGDSAPLTYKITPELAEFIPVTWTSSDPSVATVNTNGYVKGISAGTSIITATTPDGKSSSSTVIVTNEDVPVTGIKLNKTSLNMQPSQTETLSANVTPSDATDPTVTWRSNNTSVATVDGNGKVTAVAKGTAVISARAGGKEAACSVTVDDLPKVVTDIVIPVSRTLYLNETLTLVPDITPTDARNKEVTWESDKTNVATVDEKGNVKGIAVGEAKITVTAVDGGKNSTCTIKVIAKPSPSPSPSPSNPYKLYINDQRTNNAPHKDMVRGTVETLAGDRYLVITDSDGSVIKPRINGDSSLEHARAVYMDIRIKDAQGNDKADFGKCTIRIPLIDEMDVHNGTVKVVAVNGDGLDKSISSSTGKENDVNYVTFTTNHFCEYAILYKLNQDVIDYYNNYYRSLANLYNQAYGTGGLNNTRVLDHVPRTGYRYEIRKKDKKDKK